MIIEIKVQAASHHVSVRAPQAKLTDKILDVVACFQPPGQKTKRIVAIGKTADDLKREAPQQWERDKTHISFVRPFDVAGFDPVLISAVLDYYTQRVYARLRPGLLVRWLGQSFDRFDYDLQIKDYEQLPADQRAEFVRVLKRYLPRIHALSVNGQSAMQVARRGGATLSLAILVVFWWLVLGAVALLILSRVMGGAAPGQPGLWQFLLVGGIILSVSYLSALLGSVTWIAVMSRRMNRSTLMTFLPSLRLPAGIKRWAVKTFLGETNDGA